MTRFLASWLAASFLVAAALPVEARTIKLATLAPKVSPWHDVIQDIERPAELAYRLGFNPLAYAVKAGARRA